MRVSGNNDYEALKTIISGNKAVTKKDDSTSALQSDEILDIVEITGKQEKGIFSKEKDEISEMMQYSKRLAEQMEREKEAIEKSEESFSDFGKCMEIARRIARGDIVPASDHKKLMEFDMEMYMRSKMAGMMAKNRDPEEHEALFEDEETMEDKMEALEGEYADMSASEVAKGGDAISAAASVSASVSAEASGGGSIE